MQNFLNEGEVLNDLLGYDGLKIIQNPEMFNFSLDSTLLGHYATLKKGVKSVVDLCAGNAPVPLFLSLRTQAKIIAVEIQDQSADLAKRNVAVNNLASQIEVVHGDLKGIHAQLGMHQHDVVTCNPPYFKVSDVGHFNKNDYLTIARHEVLATLEDVIGEASLLLKNGGRFAMVHRPDRLVDILETLRRHRIEPKRMRLVYPRSNGEANVLLIEGIKNGNSGNLRIDPPLYVYENETSLNYSQEILDIFMLGKKE
ncbi:MAG: tRNA1(Val) (adenine(37)-N6)-methyltransferase [Turicibacter sp.]|nr:tRNA1(Val) (adenine(37)-N6)-methyltransferase [Turicibacter sp.]